ncbi:MAG TPA: hypothetical protein VFZ33_04870 [Chitinophagaceae bacterium]
MADKTKSQSDNFIAKIVKDPRQVPDTLLLSGYLGASSEDKYSRLYFDAQLNSYVEIPDDAILHTQDYPVDPLGKSYVWIKKDAVLIHGKAGTKAKFLEGPIVNDYMNAAGLAQGPVGDTIFVCPETHLDFPCGTTRHGWACTIVQLPTQERYCPTQYRPYCPPITPRCPTYSDGPAICPTKICEVQYQDIGQQQAQPLGLTVSYPLCNPTVINPPYCRPTLVGPHCITQNSPICNYTISGPICPTHTPACYPSVNKICVTHTPICYPSVQQICVTLKTPPCNIKTVNDPICFERQTLAHCPFPTADCPYGGGYGGGYPGY